MTSEPPASAQLGEIAQVQCDVWRITQWVSSMHSKTARKARISAALQEFASGQKMEKWQQDQRLFSDKHHEVGMSSWIQQNLLVHQSQQPLRPPGSPAPSLALMPLHGGDCKHLSCWVCFVFFKVFLKSFPLVFLLLFCNWDRTEPAERQGQSNFARFVFIWRLKTNKQKTLVQTFLLNCLVFPACTC